MCIKLFQMLLRTDLCNNLLTRQILDSKSTNAYRNSDVR